MGPPWWFYVAATPLVLAVLMMSCSERTPQQEEKPPEVLTACVNGQLWTTRHDRYGTHQDAIVIVNSASVNCKEK